MRHLLNKTIEGEAFSYTEAYNFIMAIDQETISQEVIAGILVGIQLRGIHLEELKGFKSALLELCVRIELESYNAIDLCGTGGDGKDTFNISTTTSLILAGMGYKVIKHGNYGVSSICGSSNVLEALGFNFTTDKKTLECNLKKDNICFLHAPLFHPTMKKIAPVRRSLGIRTIFNCLGPLVNPAQPMYQLTGTYSLEMSKLYQHILKENRNDYRVVYGMDGYDEITLTDATRVLGKHVDFIVDSTDFSTKKINTEDLFAGKSIQNAAQIIIRILNGEGTNSQNDVIASNAALALQMLEPNHTIQEAFNETIDFIKSGSAAQLIKN
ncbi:MAG: anthranilate phosphoribosyltransferase [Crocinitomicaceae bacterium]|nr:anthranilate phosphoribosyltransferase [Crocinitomicaceae bacterium]